MEPIRGVNLPSSPECSLVPGCWGRAGRRQLVGCAVGGGASLGSTAYQPDAPIVVLRLSPAKPSSVPALIPFAASLSPPPPTSGCFCELVWAGGQV